jgi:uncharacterized protein YecE (DUF72 family)
VTGLRVRAGTSGYSYPEWRGHFYPEKLAPKDMLRFYGERFRTVEINNTFYRMPTPALLEGWAAQVPDDFTFALKAPRRITHILRLREVGDLVMHLVQTSDAALGPRGGPFLFQLPPFLRKDAGLLRDFLSVVPGEARMALEFRHVTWFDDEIYQLLRGRNAALCWADTGEADDAPPVATADWGYLRLRRIEYDEGQLAAWAERTRAQAWSEAVVYFKHEDQGTAPRLAARFLELCGQAAAAAAGPAAEIP